MHVTESHKDIKVQLKRPFQVQRRLNVVSQEVPVAIHTEIDYKMHMKNMVRITLSQKTGLLNTIVMPNDH